MTPVGLTIGPVRSWKSFSLNAMMSFGKGRPDFRAGFSCSTLASLLAERSLQPHTERKVVSLVAVGAQRESENNDTMEWIYRSTIVACVEYYIDCMMAGQPPTVLR